MNYIFYTDFEKFATKFQENPSLVKEVVECGRTDKERDKQDEANGRFSVFC
jgi:hypothetical protein